MTSKDLSAALVRCAENARAEYPASIDTRARTFIARLCGSLESLGEKALADKLQAIILDAAADSVDDKEAS